MKTWLAIAGALLLMHSKFAASQSDAPVLLNADAAAGQTQIDLPVNIVQTQEGRLQFSSVRATMNVDQLAVIDPAGVRVWSGQASAVGTPRNETARPELGESYLVPQVRDPTRGNWILRLSRARARASAGKVQAAYLFLDRFQIDLAIDAPAVRPLQPVIVRATPTDYGAPISSLQLQLEISNAAGERVATLALSEGLRNAAGIALTDEPGAYLARATFPGPGNYTIGVSHTFSGGRGPASKSARKTVQVTGSAPSLHLTKVNIERASPTGCINRVGLEFTVTLAAAPATYVVRVAPLADNPTLFSASARNDASKFGITVMVEKSALQRLRSTAALRVLHQVSLLRFGGDTATAVAEWQDIAVSPPLPLADICQR